MTILPKKKNNNRETKGTNDAVDKVDDSHQRNEHPHPHQRYNNYAHHPHGHSPTRWSAQHRVDDKRAANDSDGLSDGGPSHSKRRHRAEHRSLIRKNKTGAPVNVEVVVDKRVDDVPSCSRTSASQKGEVSVVEGNGSASPSGYNSSDEYEKEKEPEHWSREELEERERQFEKKLRKKGYNIKPMGEDGACLFRAVADQIYGDQDMHGVVRKLCMDYMAKNSDYFSQYVTEDFDQYIQRKRLDNIHGNHIEMQALSEIFNRPIEVYHYSSEPINIFQGCQQTENEPIRLSYHRNIHYNSIIDPYKATIGVGLGFPGLKPGLADKNLLDNALRQSEQQQLEQAMLEDKIRATDWEATNEAIEEQVARESYIEWLRETELRQKTAKSASASATSTASANDASKSPSIKSPKSTSPRSSPKASSSGVAGASSQFKSDFSLVETASFMHQMPPSVFGLTEWREDDILAKVLAQSQQEYLDSLKQQANKSSTASNDVAQPSESQCKSPNSPQSSTSKS